MKVPVPVNGSRMCTLVGESVAELLAADVVGGAQDEVDDLHRGVDHAEAAGLLLGMPRRTARKAQGFVWRPAGCLDLRGALADRLVEDLQLRRLRVQPRVGERGHHVLHRDRDRVVGGEGVVLEQCVEHRSGDQGAGWSIEMASSSPMLSFRFAFSPSRKSSNWSCRASPPVARMALIRAVELAVMSTTPSAQASQ